LVKEETAHISKTINEMSKFWDAKLVKIRQENETFHIVKKLDRKAESDEVERLFN